MDETRSKVTYPDEIKGRWHIRSMKAQDRRIRKKAKIDKMQIGFFKGKGTTDAM